MPVRKPLRVLSVALNSCVNLSFDDCGIAHSEDLEKEEEVMALQDIENKVFSLR